MLFKCKNCGGNVVFEPSRQKMYCPHCEGEDSENLVTGGSAAQCLNCGAPLELPEDASAARCSHCGSYLIFDERVEGALRPNLVLPFRLNKEQAVAKLNQEFSNRVFTPSDFMSTKSLEQMEGDYVPFWLYDFQAQYDFVGEGTRVRTWRSGNTEYVETSYYEVVRRMDADFDKVPVDASYQMDDSVMDLMEPYDYQALENFDPKFMSGFYAQIYNQPPQELEGRARDKAGHASEELLQQSLSGYGTMRPLRKNLNLQPKGAFYALLPVWRYRYRYRNQDYLFYVNGQTGKVIGASPVSRPKVLLYSASVFALVTAVCGLALRFLWML